MWGENMTESKKDANKKAPEKKIVKKAATTNTVTKKEIRANFSKGPGPGR